MVPCSSRSGSRLRLGDLNTATFGISFFHFIKNRIDIFRLARWTVAFTLPVNSKRNASCRIFFYVPTIEPRMVPVKYRLEYRQFKLPGHSLGVKFAAPHVNNPV